MALHGLQPRHNSDNHRIASIEFLALAMRVSIHCLYWKNINKKEFFEWNPPVLSDFAGVSHVIFLRHFNIYYVKIHYWIIPIPPTVAKQSSLVQSKMMQNYNRWYQPAHGDECNVLPLTCGTFNEAGLLAWNPELNSDSSGIMVNLLIDKLSHFTCGLLRVIYFRRGFWFCMAIPGTGHRRPNGLPTSTPALTLCQHTVHRIKHIAWPYCLLVSMLCI